MPALNKTSNGSNLDDRNTDEAIFSIVPLPSVWDNIRHNGLFCDAVIESTDKITFKVHRVILAASSDYLRAVFINSSAPKITLDFPSDIVENLIEFCYSGSCQLNKDNVETLLVASDQIGIVGLVEACCSFLKNMIDEKNCWKILDFSRTYFCTQITNLARKYLLHNFLSFFKEKDQFVMIKKDDLVSLLSDDYLNIKEEKQVFDAVDCWIKSDLPARQGFATELFKCIRFNFIDKAFFYETVLDQPYVKQIGLGAIETIDSIVNGPELRLFIDPFDGTTYVLKPFPLFMPRIPHEVVFAVSGWNAQLPTNFIETYDPRTNYWFPCEQRDVFSCAYHGLVSAKNCIYVIGGFDAEMHLKSVRCFDVIKSTWKSKACMHYSRCYVACVVIDDYIYAIGGTNANGKLRTVERYCIKRNQWKEVASMHALRSDAGAAAYKGNIYVAGGFSGQSIHASAEMYDPKADIWIPITAMNSPRSGLSLIHYDRYIYAIGGYDGTERLQSMERYHPIRQFWDENLPPMKTPRSNFSCTILEGSIFVAGGFDGGVTLSLTERFDGKCWFPLAAMNMNRSALGLCTLTGLPNVEAYTLAGRKR